MKEPDRRPMHNGPRPKDVKKYPLDHPMDSMRTPTKSSIEIIKSKYKPEEKKEDKWNIYLL